MINLGSRKYKGLLITISFFLVFFILVGLFNIYLGKSVNDESNRLNLINDLGGQINQANTSVDQDNYWQRALAAAKFIKSGGSKENASIPPINSQVETNNIDDVIRLLSGIGESTPNGAQKSALVAGVDKLKSQWQNLMKAKEKRFLILQIASIVLAIIYFLGIVFQMVRNFDNIDSEIEVVKNETENILSTVNEGLFLITPDFEIGAQQSQALRGIFGLKEDIEGNFFEFLNSYVSENSLEVAKDFLGLLFGKRVKEKLIDDLNPLKRIQINLERRDGSFETHYVNFDFKRVLEEKEVKYVLGSVTDVTQEVLLELELEETKIQSEAQIDLFLSVLHVPPAQLKLFVNDTSVGLNQINTVLKDNANKNYTDKINEISRIVHKVKGDAALLNLHSFEVKAHEFEDVISEISQNPQLKGEDLLPLAMQLKGMISHKDTFLSIFDKFDTSRSELSDLGITKTVETGPSEEVPAVDNMLQLVKRVAEESGKQAGLLSYRTLETDFEEGALKPLEDCQVQLLRNAVAHGIETPKQRLAAGKPAMGTIYASVAENETHIELIVKDDGAGIDIEAIKSKAIENGLFNEEQLAEMTDRQIAGMIFRPKMSTKNEADINAGRGAGLDLVHELVKTYQGKIGLNWKQGKFTAFKISLLKSALINSSEKEYKVS